MTANADGPEKEDMTTDISRHEREERAAMSALVKAEGALESTTKKLAEARDMLSKPGDLTEAQYKAYKSSEDYHAARAPGHEEAVTQARLNWQAAAAARVAHDVAWGAADLAGDQANSEEVETLAKALTRATARTRTKNERISGAVEALQAAGAVEGHIDPFAPAYISAARVGSPSTLHVNGEEVRPLSEASAVERILNEALAAGGHAFRVTTTTTGA